jgi:6-pyruvoyltetrahydropterin/6-carboxytetrahydropterin synthase
MIYLLRKIYFSAMHLYTVSDWSMEQNQRVFGPCSNPNGHGHDYTLEVMVRGELNPKSGIVINVTEINREVKQVVHQHLDGKFLNKENPWFEQHNPTTENIVYYLWDQLEERFASCELYSIKLRENHYISAEKERGSLVRLSRKYHFCAAHRLHSELLSEGENIELFGQCNNPHGHGHNYYLEVTVGGETDEVTGMVMNLTELDDIVNRFILQKFDHKHLNLDTEEFSDLNPTSDHFVKVIWELLFPHLPKLFKIGLWETEKNYFEYYGSSSLVDSL